MSNQFVPPSSPVEAEAELELADLQPHQRVQRTIWQDPMVQNLLPLTTSVILHVIVIVIGIIFLRSTKMITLATREQITIPDAAIIEGAQTGGIPNPGLGGDPNLAAAQNVDPNVTTADGWYDKRSESLTTTLMGGGASDAADSVIGLGTRSGVAGTGNTGSGGSGGDAGGPMAPFGVPGGGQGLGPKSPFMGISGNAKRVVYICDASGSMMSVFFRVRIELRKAIDVLKPIQGFNVVFLSDEEVTVLNKGGLVMATPDNKRKAYELIERTSSSGNTESALPAIRAAFEQKPELIYLLTDGLQSLYGAEMSQAAIEEVRRLNKEKKVRVNVILIRSANEQKEFLEAMKTLANENGGVCKIIDRQDL
jgi:hypothetical protein